MVERGLCTLGGGSPGVVAGCLRIRAVLEIALRSKDTEALFRFADRVCAGQEGDRRVCGLVSLSSR